MSREGHRLARVEAFEQARRVALLISSNGRTLIESGRRVLLTMAQSPAVKQKDGRTSSTFFTQVLTGNPEFENIMAVDGQGRIFASALENGRGISVSDRIWFKRVLDRQAFTVGEPVVTRVTGRECMVLAYPVTSGDALAAVTAVTLDMAWIKSLAESLPLPAGATVSIVDRAGTFLTRYPEGGDWFEKSIPRADSVLPALLEKGVDTVEADGIDGQLRLYALAPLISEPGNEFFVRIGIPASEAYARVWTDMVRNMALLAGVGLLILLATSAFAKRFILSPARRLSDAARRLSDGDLAFRIGVSGGHDELSRVASAFDTMAESLQSAMERLSKAEARYRGLFERSVQGIVSSTPDGRVIEANPAMAAMLGFSSIEEARQRVQNLATDAYVDPRRRGELLAVLDQADEAVGFVIEARKRDGSRLWLSLNTRCVRDETGAVTSFETFVTDVTRQKVLEDNLRRSKEQAEEASRSKSDFLALMSHEIRTPMNSVIGLTQITLQTRLRQEQRDYLENVLMSARSLLGLINDILDISKIEAQAMDLENVDFCLPRAVSTTIKTMRVQSQAKGLELDVSIGRGVPRHVKGDPGRVRQILVNLVGNAIKFTETGSITVSAEPLPPDMERRVARHDGVPVLFCVRDTGVGIPTAKLPHVFEPFRQGDRRPGKRRQGTGLGLSICRRLVEMMGGELWVESEEGRGSAFFFTVCFAPGDPLRVYDPARGSEALPRTGVAPLRVLLAEDDSTNAKVATSFLRRLGHFTVTARDGLEALAMLARDDFDVVLMDLEMPELDGLEATQALRAGQAGELNRNVPVVALTAHALAGIRESCLEAGMTGYLAKPFDLDAMAGVLEGIQARRAAQRLPAPAGLSAASPRPGEAEEGRQPEAVPARRKVMIVEDDPAYRMVLEKTVTALGHDATVAASGAQALELLPGGFDLLLVDVLLPDANGLDLVASIRAIDQHQDLPIIVVTSLSDVEERAKACDAGANDFIVKPVDAAELQIRMRSLLRMWDASNLARFHQANLEEQVRRRTEDLSRAVEHLTEQQQCTRKANMETILCLASAAEFKDEMTSSHLNRMSEYCALLATRLGLPETDVELVRQASPMHDVGKIGIPDSILFKPGKLDADEWEIMRRHTIYGARILESATSELIQTARVIALSHHERWDGSGYPLGLKSEEIPLLGRICAVADVFDALTSSRPYKKAFSVERSVEIMEQSGGEHFDPRVLKVFLDHRHEFVAIMERFSSPPEGAA